MPSSGARKTTSAHSHAGWSRLGVRVRPVDGGDEDEETEQAEQQRAERATL
jgi:hypothetical protein